MARVSGDNVHCISMLCSEKRSSLEACCQRRGKESSRSNLRLASDCSLKAEQGVAKKLVFVDVAKSSGYACMTYLPEMSWVGLPSLTNLSSSKVNVRLGCANPVGKSALMSTTPMIVHIFIVQSLAS